MTEQEIKAKFDSLTNKEQANVIREVGIIKECAANTFFIETGCQADDPQSQVTLTGFAMMDLRLITVSDFHGI
ncbi:MAG: hypothetical protein GY743_23315 [Planctomycetaceae bacterium]|nr:hypothetical protein [Planctomycetaceae bacterium]